MDRGAIAKDFLGTVMGGVADRFVTHGFAVCALAIRR
jgi:hypothetical protein